VMASARDHLRCTASGKIPACRTPPLLPPSRATACTA
jgi:hypothetical protein